MNQIFQLYLLFGHETDFTIADFVSDLRAPTPSAAAELAVPEISKIEECIISYQSRYRIALKKKVEYMKLQFEKCMQSRCYKDPLQGINEKYINIDILVKNIVDNSTKKILIAKKEIEGKVTKLDALSPLKTLMRGYSLTSFSDSKKIITKSSELKVGDDIEIRFQDGTVSATVKNI